MPALGRILVATDFSAMAGHAAERAALIARSTRASLDLIHIATPALFEKFRRLAQESPAIAEAEQELLDSAKSKLCKQAAIILERHGIASDIRVVSGTLVKELVGRADATGADLIVLGFCGASLMRHFLLGSTAERLVTKAPCPMLVVKNNTDREYRSVLVPVDFSPISLHLLLRARAVAAGAEISLLHVYEAPFEGKLRHAGVSKEVIRRYRIDARRDAMHRLRSLCQTAGIPEKSTRLLAIHGNPSHGIVAQETLRRYDLIVMGKQGENMFENLFVGSVTRHVMTKARCDVLICV